MDLLSKPLNVKVALIKQLCKMRAILHSLERVRQSLQNTNYALCDATGADLLQGLWAGDGEHHDDGDGSLQVTHFSCNSRIFPDFQADSCNQELHVNRCCLAG